MRKLTIVSVAYPFAPVNVDGAGGAEQMLARLDDAIVRAGHRSVVVAGETSRTKGVLVPVPADAGVVTLGDSSAQAAVREVVARVLARESVDVVHMHGIDFDECLPAPGPPVIATMHFPPSWYSREALRPTRPRTYLRCVSHVQQRAMPSWASPTEVIENGLRMSAFRCRKTKARYCLLFAHLGPECRIHDVIEAADQAGITLLAFNDLAPSEVHQRYVSEVVAPSLESPHRWIGSVGVDRQRRLLAAARALIVPSGSPETSSLVTMEALASGTPVIAHEAGVLPHLVDDGKTGFIVRDAPSMARAMADIGRISPLACRRAASARFSYEKMTSRYLELYERLSAESKPMTTPRREVATMDFANGRAAARAS